MKKMFLLKLVIVFSLFASFALAHETGVAHDEEALNPGAGALELVTAAFGLVLVIGVACALVGEKLGATGKKLAFALIALVSVCATIYLVATIVVLFTSSATGGPVHWHADFEIWACGEKISLKKADGWATRVGPLLLHHHGDDRIHIEGVVRSLQDVSLREFFRAIGGDFTQSELAVVAENGELKAWRNGEQCPDGSVGTLKMFVNGKPNDEYGNHVISHYTEVPPGDAIKIVFDSTAKQVPQ